MSSSLFVFMMTKQKARRCDKRSWKLGELHNNSGDQIKAEMQYTAHTT
jgi:hypothetical protein